MHSSSRTAVPDITLGRASFCCAELGPLLALPLIVAAQAQGKATLYFQPPTHKASPRLLNQPPNRLLSSSSESISVPMIPLGLKETKELDLLVPLKVRIGVLHSRCDARQWRGATVRFEGCFSTWVWLGAVEEMLQQPQNVFCFGTAAKK